jgi:hypothetical protein
MTESTIVDWARGDLLGLDLPGDLAALKAGGAGFLTRAFHASGALAADNEVTEITRLDDWLVGGTGAKAMLSVAYARDDPGLSRDLFVKFSRNFTDRTRDSARRQMEPEVRLANLSRDPNFPIAVPKCAYADFHNASGTGVIITERIPYGRGPVERHHPKCMDHVLPEPPAHYRALISTLALLSGSHKAGRLGRAVERDFPLDLAKIAGRRNPFDEEGLAMRVNRLADFIARHPHLAPPHLADPAFLDSFRAEAPLLIARQDAIIRRHVPRPEMIALCHWNANIDNAWFWREPDGTLKCGLIDWGGVGQMNVCQSVWGSISGSEPDMLDRHLDELLGLYVAEYARAGGPALDKGEFVQQFEVGVMMSGLASMLIAPRAILSEVPDPGVAVDRYDPLFTANETARVQLKIMINFLNLWSRRDFGRLLRSPSRSSPPQAAASEAAD